MRDGQRSFATYTETKISYYGEEPDGDAYDEDIVTVCPSKVGAKVCPRVECEFAWFAVEGFRECPACELRGLRS